MFLWVALVFFKFSSLEFSLSEFFVSELEDISILLSMSLGIFFL